VRKRVDKSEWQLISKPAGKAGKQPYRLRAEVESWFGERRHEVDGHT
jgi:hypothetical protein